MKNCLLIDGNNIFSKYYYANKENCVKNLIRYVKNLIQWSGATYAACVFDAEKSFRKDIYSDYKSTRTSKPEDFYKILENFKNELKKDSIFIISSKTLEAEDTISLFVNKFNDIFFYVISEDKDCLQLKQYDNCCVLKKWNDPLCVPETCEIDTGSDNFIDKIKLYFSLLGDSSDNIPGVNSFGPKKSNFIVERIETYQNLKKILQSDIFELEIIKKDTDKFDIYRCLELIKMEESNLDLSYKLFSLFETSEDFNFDINKLLVKKNISF